MFHRCIDLSITSFPLQRANVTRIGRNTDTILKMRASQRSTYLSSCLYSFLYFADGGCVRGSNNERNVKNEPAAPQTAMELMPIPG